MASSAVTTGHAEPAPGAGRRSEPPLPRLIVVAGDVHASRIVDALASSRDIDVARTASLSAAIEAARAIPHAVICTSVDRQRLRSLRTVRAAILLVGPHAVNGLSISGGRDVVVALDGSPAAEGVLPVVTASAALLGGAISLAHVARPTNDRLAAGYLAGVAWRLKTTGTDADWEVLHGPVCAALIDHARHRASVIALNALGHSCGHASVPVQLALRSPVPVLVTWEPEVKAPPAIKALPRDVAPTRPATAPCPRRVPLGADRGGTDTLKSAALAYQRRSSPPTSPMTLERTRKRARRPIPIAVFAMALIGVIMAMVPVPYASVTGATRRADLMLSTDAIADPDRGRILLTLVDKRRVTPLRAVQGWLDPAVDIASDPSASDAGLAAHRELMGQAVLTATAIAIDRLGMDPVVVHVRADTDRLGGPSGGLAFALATIDLLSPGDLTRGRLVAATGEVTSDGRVLSVSGAHYKAAAAWRAGADVLFVPVSNRAEAVRAAPLLRVIPVATLDDAIDALERL